MENDKIKNAYEAVMKKLVAIVGGTENLSVAKKVSTDDLNVIVVDLLAEERKANTEEIKNSLKALLKGHVELRKEIKKKQQELNKFENEKMEEFTKTAKALFERVDNLDQKERDYYAALSAASASNDNPPT